MSPLLLLLSLVIVAVRCLCTLSCRCRGRCYYLCIFSLRQLEVPPCLGCIVRRGAVVAATSMATPSKSYTCPTVAAQARFCLFFVSLFYCSCFYLSPSTWLFPLGILATHANRPNNVCPPWSILQRGPNALNNTPHALAQHTGTPDVFAIGPSSLENLLSHDSLFRYSKVRLNNSKRLEILACACAAG